MPKLTATWLSITKPKLSFSFFFFLQDASGGYHLFTLFRWLKLSQNFLLISSQSHNFREVTIPLKMLLQLYLTPRVHISCQLM